MSDQPSVDYVWRSAIDSFWETRHQQAARQAESGTRDAGTRGSVTAGKHLDLLAQAVGELFSSYPLPGIRVLVGRRLSLPGYYRRAKDWDLVVTFRGALVAAVEFKSQVGSFGNNFNNRTEEAIGNAADVWRAYQEGAFGHIRPWLGFILVVEATEASTSVVKESPALFAPDPVFDQTGYLDRYRILVRRLVREKLYDAAVVVATQANQGGLVEPEFDLSFANFQAAVAARLAYIAALPDAAFNLTRE